MNLRDVGDMVGNEPRKGAGRSFTREELLAATRRSLDLFWLKDKSLSDPDNLPEPDELDEEIIENIEAELSSLKSKT